MQLQALTADIDQFVVVVAPAHQPQPPPSQAQTQTQTAPANDGLADSRAPCGAARLIKSGFGRSAEQEQEADASACSNTRSTSTSGNPSDAGACGASSSCLLLVVASDACLRDSSGTANNDSEGVSFPRSQRHPREHQKQLNRPRAAAPAGHLVAGYDSEGDDDASSSGGDVRLVADQDDAGRRRCQSAYWRRRRQRAAGGASNTTTPTAGTTAATATTTNQFNTCQARCRRPASLLRHKHSSACAEQRQQQQPTRDESCSSATNWCATNNAPDCALRWQTSNSPPTHLARNYDTKLAPPPAGKEDAPLQANNNIDGNNNNSKGNNVDHYCYDAANANKSAYDQNNVESAGHEDSSDQRAASRGSRSHLNSASFAALASETELNNKLAASASEQNEPRAEHASRQGAHHFQAHSNQASVATGTDAQQVTHIGRPEAQPSPIAEALRRPLTIGAQGSKQRLEERFVAENTVEKAHTRILIVDSKSRTNSCDQEQRQTQQQQQEEEEEEEENQFREQQEEQRQREELTSRAAMEILQQRALEDRLSSAQIYPNNTLIADLGRCHRNIVNLWPQASHAVGLGGLVCAKRRSIGHHHKVKKSRYKFHMPEVLIRANVKLKLDEYDRALSVLTSDVRFQLHLLLYRRVQTIWLLLSTVLCILTPVALANFEFLVLAGAFVVWLCLQALGAVVTTQSRKKLDQMLEKSVAQVNTFFMDHNLMLGVINVGSLISKAKLVIPMLYFDTLQCREQIESIISIDSRKDADDTNNKHILDYSKIDLPLTKPDAVALAKSQLAKKIVLRYSQRWISYFDKRKLMFTDDRTRPRHLSTGKCLCQFIEEHFRNSEQQCGQAKHNQKPPSAINSPYSNTKATLLINGKEQQKSNKHKKHQKRLEGRAVSQVISDERETTQNGQLPSLSRLVSLKETQEHFSIEMRANSGQNTAQQQQSNNHHQPNGFAANLWPQYYKQQHLPEMEASHTASQTFASQSTSSSAEVSLEMGNDLIGRSDDLVRKLRLLLELRKNELQGIDGSLFSAVLYKAPHQFSTIISDEANLHQDPSSEEQSRRASAAVDSDNNNGQIKSSGGKKFFNQREGLFFLGSGGGKKSPQQQAASTNQVLEIC